MTEAMTGIAANIPVIDVDTHLLEPPDLWTSRLPKKWHDEAPHVVEDPATGRLRWKIGRCSPTRSVCMPGRLG